MNSMQNRNTSKMTTCHKKLFQTFLQERGEFRDIHKIQPEKLDKHLASFFFKVKKSNGEEYEPGTLVSIQCSINRLVFCFVLYFSDIFA